MKAKEIEAKSEIKSSFMPCLHVQSCGANKSIYIFILLTMPRLSLLVSSHYTHARRAF